VTFTLSLPVAIGITLANICAVVFAAGILWEKVDGVSDRVKRIEITIDQFIIANAKRAAR
jgi:hypothetical protein